MFFVCLFVFFRLYCCLEPRAQHDQEACLVHHTQRVRHHVTGGCRAWTRCIAACTHAHARHSAAPTTTTVAVTVDWLLVCCGPVSPTPNPPLIAVIIDVYHKRRVISFLSPFPLSLSRTVVRNAITGLFASIRRWSTEQ